MAQRSIFIRDGYFGTDKSVAVMDTTPSGNEPAMVVRIIGSATIAGGGTSSNFAATFPPAGTAAGFTDGIDMQPATVFDLDTGLGTQYVLGASLRFSSSGGSVEAGTASNPLNVTLIGAIPAGSNVIGAISNTSFVITQSTAANLNATVFQGGVWTTNDKIFDSYGNDLTSTAGSLNVNVTDSLSVGGLAASGSPTSGSPVLIAGSDGANVRTLHTDSSGNLLTTFTPSFVAAPNTTLPADTAWIGASDGVNLQGLLVESASNKNLRTSVFYQGNELLIGNDGYTGVHQAGTWTVGVNNFPATQAVTQSTSPWVVSGTVTANQGGAPWSNNITQFGGNNVVTGTGGSGVGIPRVTIANDSNILATQSGTWTVQQGTPPWSVSGSGTFTVAGTVATTQSGTWTTTLNGLIDTNNSTTLTLAGNAAFMGTATDAYNYSAAEVLLASDQASAALGVNVQFSNDGVNWDEASTFSYTPGTSPNVGQAYLVGIRGRYLRVVYTNGGSAQGFFRLQTVLKPVAVNGDVMSALTLPTDSNHALLAKSILSGKTTAGGGSYVDVKVNPSGTLQIGGTASIVDSTNTNNVAVLNSAPTGTEYGLITRNIPSGTQTISGTVTANQGTNPWTVSGTVTSNIGTTNGLALDSTFTGGTARTKITDGTNNATIVSTADGYSLSVHTIPSGTQTVAGTVTANQGTSPWTVSGTVTANQGGAPWSSNITQFGGNNVVTGTGGSGSGIPRVTVANDSNILATQSGTWTVQQGTPPWSMIGTKTNNVLASGANNIGVLPAIANSTLQSYTDGYQVALSVDASGSLRTVSSPISAFGWHISATVHPIAQQHFTYGIQPRDTHTFLSSGSTAVGAFNGGSDMQLTTSTSNNAFAFARSFKALHYRAGVGTMALFTAAFNAGVANSQQIAGTWSPSAGYFVGYNGTTWGCFARIGGSTHIETLTVTTAATSAGNVTVTIDGTAVVIAVTNQAGNPTRTAWEISQADFSAAGGAGTWGWDAFALGAVVYFVARRARAVAGAFTFSAGTTGSAATMAIVKAGADVTDDFGSPATPGNWTFLDALDGTGPSGLNLDKTKAIIYGISIGHLGHRGARMSISHPVSGQMFIFADYRYMNTSKFSALVNPTLYVAWGIQSNGSTTAMTLTAGSGMGGIEGELDPDEGEHWSVSAAKTATNSVVCHYLSIRNGPIAGFGTTARASRSQVKVNKIIVSVGNAATGNFVDVQVLRNATLTNLANFTQVDNTRLALWTWQDTTTTTAVASAGTVLLDPRVFVNTVFQIEADIVVLEPGELISITIAPSTGNITVDVTMFGVEIQ